MNDALDRPLPNLGAFAEIMTVLFAVELLMLLLAGSVINVDPSSRNRTTPASDAVTGKVVVESGDRIKLDARLVTLKTLLQQQHRRQLVPDAGPVTIRQTTTADPTFYYRVRLALHDAGVRYEESGPIREKG